MKRTQLYCITCLLGVMLMYFGIGSAMAEEPALPGPGAVNGEMAHRLLGKRPALPVLVLDVRTQEEFAAGHVPDAMLIPVQELQQRVGELPADKPILIICRTGRRAADAYMFLKGIWPGKQDLWYLQGTPEYKPDGTFVFH